MGARCNFCGRKMTNGDKIYLYSKIFLPDIGLNFMKYKKMELSSMLVAQDVNVTR